MGFNFVLNWTIHRPALCAEELLILLVNFMKKNMKSEQAVLPNPCLEEEEEEEEEEDWTIQATKLHAKS
jgi:hypothetical protein